VGSSPVHGVPPNFRTDLVTREKFQNKKDFMNLKSKLVGLNLFLKLPLPTRTQFQKRIHVSHDVSNFGLKLRDPGVGPTIHEFHFQTVRNFRTRMG